VKHHTLGELYPKPAPDPKTALLALAGRWDDRANHLALQCDDYYYGFKIAAANLRAEVARLWPEGEKP